MGSGTQGPARGNISPYMALPSTCSTFSVKTVQLIKIEYIWVRQLKHICAGLVNRWLEGRDRHILTQFSQQHTFTVSHFPFLHLGFLICRMGIIIFT